MPDPLSSMKDADALGEEYGVNKLLERAGLTKEEMIRFAQERVSMYLTEQNLVVEDSETFNAFMTISCDSYLMGVLHGKEQS